MKQLFFIFLVTCSFFAFSQDEKPKSNKFNHSIGLNLYPTMLGGYSTTPMMGDKYDVPFGGKHLLNLFPYYEVDYKSKIYLLAYYRYSNFAKYIYTNEFFLIPSYNFLEPNSHSVLRLGVGAKYRCEESTINEPPFIEPYINYVLYLSYQYKLNKYFNIGASYTYSYYKTEKVEGISTVIIKNSEGSLLLKLGYTFQ